MNNKLISIIIPCYNNENTIIETIQSVIFQTYLNIEIIVINDGSTDNSKSVILDFIKNTNYSFIQLISQENQGPSKARNNGFLNSSGEYIVFIDGDDKIHENYLLEAITILEKNDKIQIVYSDAEYFGAREGKWKLQEFKKDSFLIDNCIPIYAVMRSKIFKEAGMFDENLKYIEDWELWIRIIFKLNGEVFKIPKTYFYYRKHEFQKSLTDLNEITNISDTSRLYIYNKHYNLFKEKKLDLTNLILCIGENNWYKKKYYNIWYKKLFYTLKKRK